MQADTSSVSDPFWQVWLKIRRTQAELDASNAACDACKSELGACRSELDACRTELDASRSELDACKRELDARRAMYDAVIRSTSWQITAPIRAVLHRVRHR